jgi:polysaccharide export outer membrane protein
MLQSYLVDNKGNISFPIVGELNVGGLTKHECEEMIKNKIKPFMSEMENPIVTVRMSGYQISVLGEVARPGTFTVSREKITILEALAQACDLTIYGVRNNVKLIREDATGKKAIYEINLNDANLINLPYYYLQQNDVIYVTPNKVKAQNSSVGSMTTLWFSATSILISLTSLLYNILR